MTARKRVAPHRSRVSPWRKFFAVFTFAVAAAAVTYATTRPFARDVSPDHVTLGVGDWITLRPANEASSPLPLLSVEGANDESIDVRFERARLDAASIDTLREEFGIVVPGREGGISWTTHARGTGNTAIDVSMESAHGTPMVWIEPIGEGSHPGLRISMTGNGNLRVQLSVALGGVEPEQKVLQVADGTPMHIPGAVPIAVMVPAGRTFSVIFPAKEPASTVHLGSIDEHGDYRLWVRDIGVGQMSGDKYRFYACAARGGDYFWNLGNPRANDCTNGQLLSITKVRIATDNATVTLGGEAWVVRDGTADTDTSWVNMIKDNPLLSTLGATLCTALAAWMLGLFSLKKRE
ncbi:hypothetical protein [Burkholderia ubonensis]|uniref:hypothetical protein n=1 Tax=Burkholderia ubonensis TaxID=101571 RepID=UPI00114CC14D|nr:hypothetical protein [Burkholderia ubonensis]